MEVDSSIEPLAGALLAIEVKIDSTPGFREMARLRLFRRVPGRPGVLFLHGGHETYQLGKRILATPWWRML